MLARLGLVTAYGHVSARAGESMLITPAADLARVTASGVIEVPLAAGALRRGDTARGARRREHCPRARRPRRGRTWPCTGPGRTRRRSPGPSRPARSRWRPRSPDGPAARAGGVARRIGAGVRRRRAAQVARSGRTGGQLPPRRRGAAAARQRRRHPRRDPRARGGQDVAARRGLRRLPGGTGRVRGHDPVTPLSPARSRHGAPSAASCSPGSGSTCGSRPAPGLAGSSGLRPGEEQG